jgi:hypothetical protein
MQTVTVPTTTFSQWLPAGTPNIFPVLNPSIMLAATPLIDYSFTVVQKTALLPALQFIDYHWEVEFALKDGAGNVYPIQTPYLMYPPQTIVTVSPSLVLVNQATTFTIKAGSGTFFVPGTKVIKVSLTGTGGGIVDGTLIDIQTVQFTYTFPSAATLQIKLSFDGIDYSLNQLPITVFQWSGFVMSFPTSSPQLFASEYNQGCSIFGFNDVTFNVWTSTVPTSEQQKFNPVLKVSTGQISRTQTCIWDGSISGIRCRCISFADFKIYLPQTWTLSLQLNGADFLTPPVSAINYFVLEPMRPTQPSKLDQAPLGSYIIQNIRNRFNNTVYSYQYIMRNKALGND